MLNKLILPLLIATHIFASTQEVTNPMIESIELRGDYSDDDGIGSRDSEIRFNFNGDRASKELNESFNSYLDIEAKQIANNRSLDANKINITINTIKLLITESRKDLQKIKLINQRDVNSKYKERRLREELTLLQDELAYQQELLKIKKYASSTSSLKLPKIADLKQLVFQDSLSYKLLTHEEIILDQKDSIKNGMKFVSVTSNFEQERGIKFGYAFQFGEGAESSFKNIKEKRMIKKSIREYEVEFFTLKYNLTKSIKRFENAKRALKIAKKKINNTRDKIVILDELFNLHKLRREVFSEQNQLLDYMTELQSLWGTSF